MGRHGLSVRAVTSVGQPLPIGWEEKVVAFQEFISKLKEKVDLTQFGNMDEVPVSFDMPYTRTVDVKGTEDILLTTTGAEKMNFTVVLCCTADGGKCDPMVIFKRKTIPKGNFPKGIIVTATEKGWMNEEIMGQWIEKVWRRRKGAFFKPKSILMFDSHRSHLTEAIKEKIKHHSQLAVIPGGLTKILQPLDLSVNKSFKNHIRKEWEQWMVSGIHTFTKTKKMRHASYEDVCNWVSKSWSKVTTDCIKNGFRKTKLHNYGQDDDSSDSDNSDSEEIPLEILNEYPEIFETFLIESDDDFLGFESEEDFLGF